VLVLPEVVGTDLSVIVETQELEKPAEHPEQANLIVSQDTLGKDDPKYIEALRACQLRVDLLQLGSTDQ